MATRKDATLQRYPRGGYLLTIQEDKAQFEAATQAEAFAFARGEDVTRIYSVAVPGMFYQLTREEVA